MLLRASATIVAMLGAGACSGASDAVGGGSDGGAGDGPGAPPPVASRCVVSSASVACEHNVTPLVAGTAVRAVYWQTPLSPPPAAGYPVVVIYQGSFGGPALTWAPLGPDTPFGGFYQGLLQAALLDQGFTVVAPSAALGVAWQTNSGLPWELTTDKAVIDALLEEIAAGAYGPADLDRLHATGISSGGYMTSRMAVSYGGVFRSLAIAAGSYATCVGPICDVPRGLPADHPPTLFLAGGSDTTVPLSTVRAYHDVLDAEGFETSLVVDPSAGHAWLPVAPAMIPAWFAAH